MKICLFYLFSSLVLSYMHLNACGQSLQLIPNLSNLDSGFKNSTSVVFGGKLIAKYHNAQAKYQLAVYDGTSIALVANPDLGTVSGNNMVVYGGAVYFAYKNIAGTNQLAKYDGNKILLFANPDVSTYGVSPMVSPLVFNGKLFFQYQRTAAKFNLAMTDGSKVTLVSNPDSGYGMLNNLLSFNNQIYFSYYNQNYQYQLAKYDGTVITRIANPSGTLYGGAYLIAIPGYASPVLNGSLLLGFLEFNTSNFTTRYKLATYDGTSSSVTVVANPDTGIANFPLISVYGNKAYYPYTTISGVNKLAAFDGTSVSLLNNPDAGKGFSSLGIVNGGNFYIPYTNVAGKSQLVQFNGTGFQLYNNPSALDSGVIGTAYLNGQLYVNYINQLGSYQLGKVSGNTIGLYANPDAGKGVNGFWAEYNGQYIISYENIDKKSQLAKEGSGGGAGTLVVSGIIKDASGNPINNVDILASGNKIGSSDATGSYSVSLPKGGTFNLTCYKNNDVVKTNGVSSLDILFTNSHILSKALLNSPYKMLAADVNGDGRITSLDILFLKRFVLGIDTTFKKNASIETRTWTFVDASYAFPDPSNPFPYKDSITITNLSGPLTNINFIAVKLGDMNWDRNPSKGLVAAPSTSLFEPSKLLFPLMLNPKLVW